MEPIVDTKVVASKHAPLTCPPSLNGFGQRIYVATKRSDPDPDIHGTVKSGKQLRLVNGHHMKCTGSFGGIRLDPYLST